MLDRENILEIIDEVVIGIEAASIADDTDFKECGIDSLDHANVLLAIEEQFGVNIPDEDVDKCSSISGIISYVNNARTIK